jgi:4-alpha-glucanotransferase
VSANDVEVEGPDAWGLHTSWVDAHDQVHQVSPTVIEQLRDVIGTPPDDLELTAPIVTRPGRPLQTGGEVTCEDGSVRTLTDAVPDDFPLGYHRLRQSDGHERALIVSPGRCWLPEGWRAWGWTVQLYAARSRRSWGIGDLRDLKTLREWSEQLGAEFLLINPLHAVAPTFPQEASPYLPATRRFRNPIYLCVDDVEGANLVDLTTSEKRGRELNAQPIIDRDAIWALKRSALRDVFDVAASNPNSQKALAAWRNEQGQPLEDFAAWMVLALHHGPDWREWPEPLRNPRSTITAEFVAAHQADVDFQAWLQWQLDEQLRTASGDLTIIQDLPIGVDGGGADAWMWQDVLASGVTVGAPPDLFSSLGQDWGSPPLVPWRLRAADYQPFIESVRATMANAGGLRIDHVMGLFRIWWVPPGGSPADGAYVRYPSDDLLDIVALESRRQQAIVIGEDLGTVEPGVREALQERAVLSYRLLWFEEADPAEWPVSAMAAITTHDLPTVVGLWTGADLADQREYSAEPEDALRDQRAELLTSFDRADLPADASADTAVMAVHTLLATAPSILISATLDDAVGAPLRPNMPGTTKRQNWAIPLEVAIDDLPAHTQAKKLANVLNQAVRGSGYQPHRLSTQRRTAD